MQTEGRGKARQSKGRKGAKAAKGGAPGKKRFRKGCYVHLVTNRRRRRAKTKRPVMREVG